MFGLGPWDMMIVLVIAVLLFGKRLPEVARSLGKGVTEFRKGVRGIEDEFTRAEYSPPTPSRSTYEERDEPTAPKFVPPPMEESVASTESPEKATT
ncbi:MAG: Sec-independent protein translocase TatA [Planctomycetota bacterium]|nr:MAG: Sec-independent protein translocase TatA [Planctomycetota bacterium]